MANKPHPAKIIVRQAEDGKKEVSFVDTHTGREVRTKHIVTNGELDKTVRHLKESLEKAGNHVSYKEI